MCKICLSSPEGDEWCPICFFTASSIDRGKDHRETARCRNSHWWVYGIGVCKYCVNKQVTAYRTSDSLKSRDLNKLFGDPPKVKEVHYPTINEFDMEFGIFDFEKDKPKTEIKNKSNRKCP